MKKPKVRVIQDPEAPIAIEILAKAIVDVSAAAKKMMKSGLTEEAIVLLIHDESGVGKPDIRRVLRSIPELAAKYTFFDGKK